jgi:hypothetical protein
MTAFTTETKSQLAKLLATENIRIEHKKLPTAAFDPKNRVLYCPIWKDMSGYMYDLLMGHEVGHALYTPADGWHDAACSNGKNFKSFLNVIEDARIEKKVKRKYPGLRSSFVRAYKELMDKDFFGLQGRDINKQSFINRLNIYTKSDYTASIQFGAKEKELVDRVRAVETWEDVLKITGEVFAYAKEEQEENEELQFQFPQNSFGDDDGEENFDDFSDSSDFGEETNGQDGNNSQSSEESNEEGKEEGQTKSESQTDENGEDGESEDGDSINRHKFSEEFDGVMDEPTCETDNNFRQRELELLDDKSKEYVYVSFPKPNLDKIVTPANRVHELLTSFYNEYYGQGSYFENKVKEFSDEFKKKNEKYISLLAKEFEMRKAAAKFAKAKVANTGDIDISRLYKYQVDDNIFRKTMKVPNGKSHGLVMMFDRSGSMTDNMRGSIEQMLVLAMFCRKVNIPFVVYGFGNNTSGRHLDYPEEVYSVRNVFSRDANELTISGVFLREYMNSKMSNAEFSKVFRNMIALMNSYGSRYNSHSRSFRCPDSEELSNTPMNEAFVALEPITNQFRKVNNLDIVNTVLIHDGDSDWFRGWYNTPDTDREASMYTTSQQNVFVVDKKLKKEFRVTSDDNMQQVVMDWYQAKTGSKIFGFFIGGSTPTNIKNMIIGNYVDENGKSFERPKNWEEKVSQDEKLKAMVKEMKKSKFVTSYKKGYSKFFLISGGKDLEIDDGEFQFESESDKVSAKKLANAFMKFNEKRQVNRILVQKFIEGIAV